MDFIVLHKIAFTQPSSFVLLKTPRFIVKFWDMAVFMFYICCKRDAIWKVVVVHCEVAWPWYSRRCRRTSLCNSATLHDWKDGRIILYGLSTIAHILRAISHFLTISVVANSTACERFPYSSRAFPSFKFLDPSRFHWATPKQQTWKLMNRRPCECLRLSNFCTHPFQIFKWRGKFLLENCWSACSEHPSDQFSSWRWATSGRWAVRSFVPVIHHLDHPAF